MLKFINKISIIYLISLFFVFIVNSKIYSQCQNPITITDYLESFELNNIGLWTQSTNDNINWTLINSNTSSSNTGPNSASHGNYYIYTEASGNLNKVAILNSPCFDISSLDCPILSFDYHMYGSNMGTLLFEISGDNGNTWETILNKSGDQGNQWYEEVFNLTTYKNDDFILRITGTTGPGFRSDMAIDNIRIGEGEYAKEYVYDNMGNRTQRLIYVNFAPPEEVDLRNKIFTQPEHLKVFPNPTQDRLHIESNEVDIVRVSIFNLNGQKLNTIKETGQIINIDLSSYPPGQYYIVVDTENGKNYRWNVVKVE